jgi:DNA-binding transcriptional MerR regulator
MKSETALLTIKEACEKLDLPPHVLRFWETQFEQLKPQKRLGRRYYSPEDIRLLREIKFLLYEKGLTIKGAQQAFAKKKDARALLEEKNQEDFARSVQEVIDFLAPYAE